MAEYKPKSVITRKLAKEIFHMLVEELEKENALNDRTILIVDNMALMEQMKQHLLDDIKTRGVVELFKNGTQEMYRDNKSVDKILKIVEQQRKLLNELCLTPSSNKRVAEVVTVDEFEQF